MKGASYIKDATNDSREVNWSFDYLSFPLLAKFAFGDKTKLYFIIGPEFSFLLSSTMIFKQELYGITVLDEEDDITEHMNSFELAIGSGIGVEIQIQKMVLFIQLRGSVSTADIFKDKSWRTTKYLFALEEDKAALNVIPGLQVGLLF